MLALSVPALTSRANLAARRFLPRADSRLIGRSPLVLEIVQGGFRYKNGQKPSASSSARTPRRHRLYLDQGGNPARHDAGAPHQPHEHQRMFRSKHSTAQEPAEPAARELAEREPQPPEPAREPAGRAPP